MQACPDQYSKGVLLHKGPPVSFPTLIDLVADINILSPARAEVGKDDFFLGRPASYITEDGHNASDTTDQVS